MGSNKIRDIAVKVGEYQDHNTGGMKGRFENVGALFQSNKDDSLFIMLKRTFNPAGVPNPENRDSVLLSCFQPRDRQDNAGNRSNTNITLDDDVPF